MNAKTVTIFIIVLLFSAGTLFGATGDTMTIGGSVPLTLDLTVTPDANADDLTLVAAAGSISVDIATITVVTNSSAGWELWAQSSNATTYAALINADGDEIAYTLGYTQSAGEVTTNEYSGAAIGTDGVMLADDGTVSTAEAGAIAITYNQALNYPAGYYSDLLTITVRAK